MTSRLVNVVQSFYRTSGASITCTPWWRFFCKSFKFLVYLPDVRSFSASLYLLETNWWASIRKFLRSLMKDLLMVSPLVHSPPWNWGISRTNFLILPRRSVVSDSSNSANMSCGKTGRSFRRCLVLLWVFPQILPGSVPFVPGWRWWCVVLLAERIHCFDFA